MFRFYFMFYERMSFSLATKVTLDALNVVKSIWLKNFTIKLPMLQLTAVKSMFPYGHVTLILHSDWMTGPAVRQRRVFLVDQWLPEVASYTSLPDPPLSSVCVKLCPILTTVQFVAGKYLENKNKNIVNKIIITIAGRSL